MPRSNNSHSRRSVGFSSTVHGNNIAVEDQRMKLRLVIETAQEIWGDS